VEHWTIHWYSSGESFQDVHYPQTLTRMPSAGFDASEHETPSMSRHNRKVPTSFFYRFTQDVCAFANKWAQGRIVSVLEGGYSDKALLSGAMAHLVGLVDGESVAEKDNDHSRETWWSPENVQMVRVIEK
jgi:histone deacetylase HOS3